MNSLRSILLVLLVIFLYFVLAISIVYLTAPPSTVNWSPAEQQEGSL